MHQGHPHSHFPPLHIFFICTRSYLRITLIMSNRLGGRTCACFFSICTLGAFNKMNSVSRRARLNQKQAAERATYYYYIIIANSCLRCFRSSCRLCHSHAIIIKYKRQKCTHAGSTLTQTNILVLRMGMPVSEKWSWK